MNFKNLMIGKSFYLFDSFTSRLNLSHLKLPSNLEIKSFSDFKVSHVDFIGQNHGTIHQDYSILSPEIGRGKINFGFYKIYFASFWLNFTLLIGAFGEVRRVIHRKTNITRACKIIWKD